MNRAQRRAVDRQQKQDWADGLRRVHEEAAGVLELHIIRPREMLDLLADALSGDRRATIIAQAALDTVATVSRTAASGHAKLCLSCPRELMDQQFTVVLVVPERSHPSKAIGAAMCHACGLTESDIRNKAAVAFRGIWPDLRPITITHQTGGHA
jgi:hypothetical protein